MTTKGNSKKIEGTPEVWEEGLLGMDEKHAVASDLFQQEDVDEAFSLQPISIRLQKGLLKDLKLIAEVRGLGYQSLIKQILQRFVAAEHKQIFREQMSALLKEQQKDDLEIPDGNDDDDPDVPNAISA